MTTARTQVLSLRVQIWVHVFFCTDGVLFCCMACAQCRQLGRVQKKYHSCFLLCWDGYMWAYLCCGGGMRFRAQCERDDVCKHVLTMRRSVCVLCGVHTAGRPLLGMSQSP